MNRLIVINCLVTEVIASVVREAFRLGYTKEEIEQAVKLGKVSGELDFFSVKVEEDREP